MVRGLGFYFTQVGLVELATTAFGQGVAVSPIKQVTAVSAIVNGGHLFAPTMMKSDKPVAFDDGTYVISEKTSRKVREALELVVSKGTGRGANVEGYRGGGKTGTA